MVKKRGATAMRAGIGSIMLFVGGVLGGVLGGVPGCVVNEPESPPRGVIVSGPPPAPMRDERPPAPGPQAVWVTGYWHWTGMQYAWIPGHWESPPPGQSWAGPVYGAREGKYFYETGGWKPVSSPGNRNAIR